ncbi:MAG: hypothetical protein U1E17_04955 [Geminicoccaceae bacterium]
MFSTPPSWTMDYFARELEAGRADPIASSHGFFAVKAGDLELARRIFAVQVRRGSAQAMTRRPGRRQWPGCARESGRPRPSGPAVGRPAAPSVP